jgi:hypothetical protein
MRGELATARPAAFWKGAWVMCHSQGAVRECVTCEWPVTLFHVPKTPRFPLTSPPIRLTF